MLEKEKQKTEEFARQNGLSMNVVNEEIKKIKAKIEEENDEGLSPDAIAIRAYRRVRGAFNQKVRQLDKAEEAMIVCRYVDNAYAKNQFNQAKRYELEHGKDKAIKEGYLNNEGLPIYIKGDQKGKVITEKEYDHVIGKAAGYFVKEDENGKEIIEPKIFVFSDKVSQTNIPVCQVSKIAANESKGKREENFRYTTDKPMWYNSGLLDGEYMAPYSLEDIKIILGDWSTAFDSDVYEVPKIITFNDFQDFKEECFYSKRNEEKAFDFCIAAGNITKLHPENEYSNQRIDIEINVKEGPLYISVFVDPTHLQGLKLKSGMTGVVVLQAYNYSDDPQKLSWHLGGFLPAEDDVDIEEIFFELEEE